MWLRNKDDCPTSSKMVGSCVAKEHWSIPRPSALGVEPAPPNRGITLLASHSHPPLISGVSDGAPGCRQGRASPVAEGDLRPLTTAGRRQRFPTKGGVGSRGFGIQRCHRAASLRTWSAMSAGPSLSQKPQTGQRTRLMRLNYLELGTKTSSTTSLGTCTGRSGRAGLRPRPRSQSPGARRRPGR